MDQKLLNALNNIGLALEELVDALNTKSEASTATGSAIQSGNFAEDLKSINEGIKSIKADTQTIIKNQQTIIAQGKERESTKTKDIETDPKKESAIKKGVGTILLIAVAVLAIGMAFKLVGDVNILSVIGLALGITLVAIAFEKVAELKLGLKEAAIAAAVMVIASLGLMISSHILNLVQPVAPMKMLTAIFIAAGFAVLGPSISKLVSVFKGMSMMELVKTVIFLPLILPAISLGIALSSEFLQRVQPIGLSQFISSILIAGIFVVLSFGLKKMIGAFSGIGPVGIVLGAIFLPIILVSISKAIADSSEFLSNVKMMSLGSFFGAILISVIFVVLSYSVKNMISAFKGIDPVVAVIAALFLPTILVSISQAIADSSEFLSNVKMMSLGSFFGAILISVIFVVLSYGIKRMISAFKGIDPATAVIASLVIPILMVAISGAIWASSHILDKMVIVDEEKLKNAGLLGGGLAVLAIAMIPVIKLVSKLDVKDMIKAALILPGLALIITVSSFILSKGEYDEGGFPSANWIGGVSLSLLVFGAATIGLGFLITASGGLGLPALALGGVGALIVAGTIAASSHVLKLGDYKTSYPGLDWAKGVSLSLVTFGSGMVLLGGIIFASFGIGLAMLKSGSNAVLMVAKTIVASSDILANGYTDENGVVMKPNYKGGPTKEWADGVSIALGAFSPVYGMLMKNAIFSLFGGGGVGPDDFTNAIKTVSQGIVSAAKFFASPENPGVWAGHPTKEWAEGVGLAIGAFAPVYEILAKNSGWFKSGVSPEDFAGKFDDSGKLIKDGAIQIIARGIISAAKFFADNTAPFTEGSYPSKNWGEGVGAALGAFAPVFDMLMEKSGFWKSGDSVINDMIKGIDGVSTAIVRTAIKFSTFSDGRNIFENYPDTKWGDGVKKTIVKFTEIAKYLEKEEGQYWRVTNVSNRMSSIAKIFESSKFENKLDLNWFENLKKTIEKFVDIGIYLTSNKDVKYSRIVDISNRISSIAKIFESSKFENKLDLNWSENLKKTIEKFVDIGIYLTNNKEVEYSRIVDISNKISNVDKILNNNLFESYPDMKWSDGVAKTITIFTQVTKYLEEKKAPYFELTRVVNRISSIAKIFESSKFENYPDMKWNNSIKSTIENFVNLSKYLEEQKAPYWRVIDISNRIVKMSKILHGGSEFFSNPIDPNYISNISQNMIDFNELVKKLTDSENESMLSKLGNNLLGTDPIMQIAKRMVTLADGYDKLAESLIKLGGAMRVLNISDIKMLGGLTSTITNREGDKDRLLDSVKGSFGFKKAESGPTVTGAVFGGAKNESSLKEDVEKIIKLLTNIDKSTDSSSQSLSDMLVQLRDDGIKTVSAGN